ncbi:hypothetical protein H5410_049331, partial [Solanum commersonii]
MDPNGHHRQNISFSMSNEPRNLSYRARWSPRPKRPIFNVKLASEQSVGFIGHPEFQRHFHQKFTWTSVKTLVMEPVGHHSQNVPFSIFIGDPKFRRHFCQIFTWTFIKTLAIEPIGHHDQNVPFSRSNEPRS